MAIVDFQFAWIGTPYFDVASGLQHSSAEGAFLDGYRETSPIRLDDEWIKYYRAGLSIAETVDSLLDGSIDEEEPSRASRDANDRF